MSSVILFPCFKTSRGPWTFQRVLLMCLASPVSSLWQQTLSLHSLHFATSSLNCSSLASMLFLKHARMLLPDGFAFTVWLSLFSGMIFSPDIHMTTSHPAFKTSPSMETAQWDFAKKLFTFANWSPYLTLTLLYFFKASHSNKLNNLLFILFVVYIFSLFLYNDSSMRAGSFVLFPDIFQKPKTVCDT